MNTRHCLARRHAGPALLLFAAAAIDRRAAAQHAVPRPTETPASAPATRPALTVHLNRITSPTGDRHLSAHTMRRDVGYLAGDGLRGREAGSPEGEEAAEFIVQRFREAALTEAGSPGKSYRQAFEISLGRRLLADNRVSVKGPQHTSSFALASKDMVPLAHTGTGDAYGTLAFAGYGIRDADKGHDDYAGLDAKGKVVLVLRGAPRGTDGQGTGLDGAMARKIYLARDQGAVGLLLVDLPEQDQIVADLLPGFASTVADAGIPAAAVRWWPLRMAVPGLFAVADAVRKSGKPGARVFDDVTVRIHVEAEKRTGTAYNVIGLLRGSEPILRDQIVVVGAHYDHLGLGIDGAMNPDDAGQIHNGADDNASGTATLLSLAAALSSVKGKLRRSILFCAFSGEEKGLLGSRWFLEHPTVDKERIVAMVNLDMVGRSRDGKVQAIGSGTSALWPALLAAVSPDGQIRLSDTSIGGSDHQSFINHKIPAVHFFTGVHEDYHRPGDDADKLDYDAMLGIGKLVFDVVAHLATCDEIAPFVEQAAPRTAAMGGRGGAWLGTIPAYEESSDGVRLDGASKGSPAERAGIQKGDVLVGIDDKKIANIYDFTYALKDKKPGQEITVRVRRDGKEIDLKARLASRGE